ncbi:putative zinc protease YmxG [Lentibacillus sp. JNUCC-1]|uniref:M16 family metallopeptidase n=1 Tax=Lentibacillus sp. JNUCC-1 TaxID=2654513 RepID=UPI0012E7F82B|nr:pitrilysin family protein [Lentibacillus sp. JNUCC-1]MUV39911.1 putative zinc protease YmxG [Lentibacillus sp. JNUCC-1]
MIYKNTCRNGLRIILEHVPDVRSVTIGVWIKTGSRFDPEDQSGISHFLEHMLFKGTKSRNARDIAEAFDSIGGQVNAFTSKEYTCFYAKVMDTHQIYAVEILADMFFNSLFEEEEIEREKKVVLEEINMYEDTPDDIVHDLLAQSSYSAHPLANPILGSRQHVQSFTSDELRTYMKDHYTPNNIVISAAGHINERLEDELENYFGQFNASTNVLNARAPVFTAGEVIKKKNIEQAHLCYGFSGMAVTDDDLYSLILMNNVFGGSMSSRLFQEIREKHGLAYSVFSYHSSFLDHGLLTIYAGTGVQQLSLLKDSINQTIDQFVEKGITDKELLYSKEQLKANLLFSHESTNSRMSRNGKNELLLNTDRSIEDMLNEIEAVTNENVQSVIDRLFKHKPSMALVTSLE